MGECYYYLKARFPKGSITKKKEKRIEEFFLQGDEAETWVWKQDGKKISQTEFNEKFPVIAEFLKISGMEVSDNRALEFADCGGSEVMDRLTITDREVSFYSEVSHMADWQPIADFLTKEFGASKVVWDVEENGCGGLDSLEFEDNEQIVQDILKHKKILPTLLGINKELDALIAEQMKG